MLRSESKKSNLSDLYNSILVDKSIFCADNSNNNTEVPVELQDSDNSEDSEKPAANRIACNINYIACFIIVSSCNSCTDINTEFSEDNIVSVLYRDWDWDSNCTISIYSIFSVISDTDTGLTEDTEYNTENIDSLFIDYLFFWIANNNKLNI